MILVCALHMTFISAFVLHVLCVLLFDLFMFAS